MNAARPPNRCGPALALARTPSVMNHANHNAKSLVRRTLWWGLTASVLLHATLLAVMVFGTVRSWLDERPLRAIEASATYARRGDQDNRTSATVVIHEDDPAPANFQQQFAASLAATEQLSEAQRIESLDSATSRLDRISSEASLDDVANRLQSWLGLAPRAAQPAAVSVPTKNETPENVAAVDASVDPSRPAATESKFDFETAQLHDVKRVVEPDRRPQYFCVLLDASGQTIEVPLEESEGEPIYSLMEKIKAHPLLEKIYRQLAMPLLDQMVKAERTASAAASAARSAATAGDGSHPAPHLEPRKLEPPPDDDDFNEPNDGGTRNDSAG